MDNRIIFTFGVCCLGFGFIRAAEFNVFHSKIATSPGGFLSFTCHTDEPITSCKVYHPYLGFWLASSEKEYEDRLYDLYSGVNHTYNGRGFKHGDCGILVTKVDAKHDGIWECKLETINGEVLIGTIKFDVRENGTQEELSSSALQSVSTVGDSHAALLCHSDKPIEKCEFQPPNTNYWIPFKNSSMDLSVSKFESNIRYLYYGNGLQNGDCGLYLKHIHLKDDGLWGCRVTGINGSFLVNDTVQLKVVDRPQAPVLPPHHADAVYDESNESSDTSDNEDLELSSDLDVIPHKTSSAIGGILAFTCHSDEPIRSCKIYYPNRQIWLPVSEKGYVGRIRDLSNGVNYVYNGGGYNTGDCGILITNVNYKHDGNWKCRVETKRNGKVLDGVIQLNIIDEEESLTATTLQDVSIVGGSHSVLLCHFNKPIDGCEFKPPKKDYWIPFKNSTFEVLAARSESNIRHLYYGRGLRNGDCGLFLKNIRLKDNGIWTCKASVSNENLAVSKTLALNDAVPVPDQPTITVKPKLSPDQGKTNHGDNPRNVHETHETDISDTIPPTKVNNSGERNTFDILGIAISLVIVFIGGRYHQTN